MSLGTRIRERRKANAWSQAKLAEESGISQQMLSKLERGVAFGTTEIVALARALEVSAKWLETGEGPMQDAPLAADERQLVEGYRSLSPVEKAAALTLIIRGYAPAPTGLIQATVQNHHPSQEQQSAYQAHHANQTRRVLSPPPPPHPRQ